ncbi:ribosomal RNA large subunit methyltransferase H [Roseibium aquae]|uniref:Ribosomal RNA large subunit methyltransferase H n=1 Tax=Roseibium aquae TaxID=1323746 RepID=A0A916TIW1_9HYPH|nr:23S rRNA (pseudouridine(1915)-N(3))-methyltransferase RlmH [Roseibium aquae]GGB46487.1 ribosomal RNA large subunit methyltransferase H [Roseibium aquae]
MRLKIGCIGRLKAGAEKELVDRYGDRIRKTGRSAGITDFVTREHPESRAQTAVERKREEATLLLQNMDQGAYLVVLDERGKALSSESFASRVFEVVDRGVPEVYFAIGGADGHGDDILAGAHLRLALGAMTWPHQLARVLLAEQIYRAITIRTGHPYHRV